MCGLAGYYNISRSSFSVNKTLLHKMQQAIAHRGPDSAGIWVSQDYQLGLAHRRLSIVDLSNAATQPMIDKDNTVVISFNGEIYNHQALKKELEGYGHKYFSKSDTETLLYAYKEWGIECLDHLDGMFACALFDMKHNELYLIRDRMGIKPLYFSIQEGILSFASEIKALWQLPWMHKEINPQALYHYLTYLVTPAPMTLYKGVYKLPAGFYVNVDAKRTMTFHEWYNPIDQINNKEGKDNEQEEFYVEQIRTLLREAVRKRMMADVPLGVFLSGGIDSSLLVALMSEYTDRVKTFTISFADGPEYSEVTWARIVAKQFNTDHHEIVITEKEAFDFFQKMIYYQDEPIADCVCIPLYYVAQLLKQSGVTVVQVGEGSDELFCGYQSYVDYLTVQRYCNYAQRVIPAFARKSIYSIAATLFSGKHHQLNIMKNWAEEKNIFWSGATAFIENNKRDIFNFICHEIEPDPIIEQIYGGFKQQLDSYTIVDYHLQRLYQLNPSADFLQSMIYLELKHRLPELLLMRVDKMTMATSVEGRVPFLDYKLVEFALNIPTKLKYKHGLTKYILKKAAEDILPHEIIYRKKVGFAAPISRWFKHGRYFKPYFNDVIHNKHGYWRDYLDSDKINKLFIDNNQKGCDYSLQLWVLQNVMALDFV